MLVYGFVCLPAKGARANWMLLGDLYVHHVPVVAAGVVSADCGADAMAPLLRRVSPLLTMLAMPAVPKMSAMLAMLTMLAIPSMLITLAMLALLT